jgi:hypothetical protein
MAMPAQALDKWTATDTLLQATFIGTLVLDRNQTRRIALRNDEVNPILGPSPSFKSIDAYFIGYAIAHTAVMVILPDPYRNTIQGFSIGYELSVVQHNLILGYSARF